MIENPGNDETIPPGGEHVNTQKARARDRTGTKNARNDRNGKTAPATKGVRKTDMPIRASLAHTYQTQRASKGPKTGYIVFGASVVLSGLLALYVSMTTKTAWAPAPETGVSFEPTPVVASVPLRTDQPVPVDVVEPPRENPGPAIVPNAVIDVPGVSLRNAPDINGKALSNSLKRGERVEIQKRVSGNGPAWVKIRTKAGKAGWVFASVVKELRRG